MMTIRTTRRAWALAALLLGGSLAIATHRAGGQEAQEAKSTAPVAAVINGRPLFAAEVYTLLFKQNKMKPGKSGVPAVDFANALKQLVIRRLVLERIEREGGYYTKDEIDEALERFRAQVSKDGRSLEQALASEGATIDSVRDELIWQLAWPRYIERNISDQLQGYFESHRKEFDGTQVQAGHILLRPETVGDSPEKVVALARQIREGIEAGKITFEDAAKRFSIGPSGVKGGELGYFPRRGVMHDAFAKAAFELAPGEISEPVVTPFGVHLIRVTQIKPGSKQWTEVLEELRMPAAGQMLTDITDEERKTATIEYNPKMPHFDPATEKLVVPEAPAN